MTATPKPTDSLAAFQRQLAESVRPLREINDQVVKNLQAISHSHMPNLFEAIEAAQRSFAPLMASLAQAAAQVAVAQHKCQLLEDSGWLPHTTLPLTLIDQCNDDPRELSRLIEEYYSNNWNDVYLELCSRIDRFSVDDEAKSTFREALAAYNYKMYRSVSRILMPEIERIARIEFIGAALGKVVGEGRELERAAGEMYAADIEPAGHIGMLLFERLTGHLYANIQTDDDVRRLEADDVPNRHASMHGIVSYNTAKNALNTIFMADYVFQIVSAANSGKNRDASVSRTE
jgi:hypothetical protein